MFESDLQHFALSYLQTFTDPLSNKCKNANIKPSLKSKTLGQNFSTTMEDTDKVMHMLISTKSVSTGWWCVLNLSHTASDCSSWWAVDLASHSTDTNKDTKKAGKKTSSADGVMERAVFSCPVIFGSFHMRLLRCPKINWFQFKLFVNIICWIRCQSLVHKQAALVTGRHQIAQLRSVYSLCKLAARFAEQTGKHGI